MINYGRNTAKKLVNAGVTCVNTHASGIVDLPKQSGCTVYRATTAQVIQNATMTVVQLQGVIEDIQNEWDEATNFEFTAKEAGTYLVGFRATIEALAANKILILAVYKNGTIVAYTTGESAIAGDIAHSIMERVPLAANDTIQFKLYHNHGAARNLWYTRYFTGAFIQKVI